MTLNEHLDSLPPLQRERLLGRLEGMSMAMRIARNRAEDLKEMGGQGSELRENEAQTVAAAIRLLQVGIGNGTHQFGDLSQDEIEEVLRIY